MKKEKVIPAFSKSGCLKLKEYCSCLILGLIFEAEFKVNKVKGFTGFL